MTRNLPMPLEAFVLVVLINPNIAGAGAFTVVADGREVSQFTLNGKAADPPEIRISIPANAKRLTLERRTTLVPIGMTISRQSQTFDLVSVAGISAPLREQRPAVSL